MDNITEKNYSLATESKEPTRLDYKNFKQIALSELTPGVVVEKVSPSKLFASQLDTDPTKIMRRMNDIPQETNITVPGYFCEIPRGDKVQRVLVLGDNHHLALQAWARGKKVDVKIVGSLPPGTKRIAFSVLRSNSGNPFRDN